MLKQMQIYADRQSLNIFKKYRICKLHAIYIYTYQNAAQNCSHPMILKYVEVGCFSGTQYFRVHARFIAPQLYDNNTYVEPIKVIG